MEVLDDNAAMLSNYEVFELLRDIDAGRNGQRKPGKTHTHLATIVYSTLRYLEKTPCRHQTPATIAAFQRAVEPFRLTAAERLQLLNQRPIAAVEVQLLVEESEERLTEEQMNELIQLVAQTLPTSDESPANVGVEEQKPGAEDEDSDEAMNTDDIKGSSER